MRLLNRSLRIPAAPSVYPAVVAAETLDLPPVKLTGHGCFLGVSTVELVGPLWRVEAQLTDVGGRRRWCGWRSLDACLPSIHPQMLMMMPIFKALLHRNT